jgi:hypothetical protein
MTPRKKASIFPFAPFNFQIHLIFLPQALNFVSIINLEFAIPPLGKKQGSSRLGFFRKGAG